jgi:hypothetical protein
MSVRQAEWSSNPPDLNPLHGHAHNELQAVSTQKAREHFSLWSYYKRNRKCEACRITRQQSVSHRQMKGQV